MIRHCQLTVDEQTQATSPEELSIEVCNGTLTKVVVSPTIGPNWEVYFRLIHFEDVIIPSSDNEWIPLERETLIFLPDFNDWESIYELKVQLCSPQAKYAHTVQVTLEISEIETSDALLRQVLQMGV